MRFLEYISTSRPKLRTKDIYLVTGIARLPRAILGNWCFIENWTAVSAAEPLDPFNDVCL
jgi:hypothetical protein